MIYLASPYSANYVLPAYREMVERKRFEAVVAAAAVFLRRREPVFCPIAHSHPINTIGLVDGDWDLWWSIDRPLLHACREIRVLCLDGWDQSFGVQEELEEARRLKLLIQHFSPDELGIEDVIIEPEWLLDKSSAK